MKKTKSFNQTILMALIFLIGMQSFTMASTDSFRVVEDKVLVNVEVTKNERAISLRMANLQSRKTGIIIVNTNGVEYHNSNLFDTEAFAKVYNMSELPRGNFQLVIEREMFNIVQNFVKGPSGHVILGEKYNEIKPVVFHASGKVKIFFKDGISDQVRITFLNETSETVFKDNFYVTTKSMKQFDTQALKPGRYTIQIDLASKTFYDVAVVE